MKTLVPALLLVFTFGLLTMPGQSLAQVGEDFGASGESDEPVTAELIADVQAVAPGQSFTLGLRMKMEGEWHVYWKNPEGPGFPVKVEQWQAPEGFEISDIHWPHPQRFEFAGEWQFGYGKEVVLLFDVTAPDSLAGDEFTITADASWLACEEMCIPGDAKVSLTLPIQEEPGEVSEQAAAIEESRAKLPRTLDDWTVSASPLEAGYRLTLTAPQPIDESLAQSLYFYSTEQYAVDPAAKQEVSIDGKTLTLDLVQRTVDGFKSEIERDQPVTQLSGVLVSQTGFDTADGGSVTALHLDVPIEESQATSSAASQIASERAAGYGFWLSLGAAFVGGLILNLMPCVFPVLSIKILGFVNQAGEQPEIVRRHGYAFGIGVLLSFWALAGLLLALRGAAAAAGGTETFSWGYQMQSPAFVLGMVLLMFLIGLNLAGVFEIGVGMTSLAGKAGAGTSGYTKSLLSGVLATLVATPCTAPFMAGALGAALAMPPLQAMTIFTSLGIGMATPYVLLSCFPRLLNYLPRPGAWMESFKQAMSFPMFAAAGYFVWVLASLTGESMVAWILIGLSVVAMGAWVYGRWSTPMRSPKARAIGRVVAAVFVVAGTGMIQWQAMAMQAEQEAIDQAKALGEYAVEWVDFSPEKIEALRQEGRPVLIDFTATWCITCQANKRTALRTDSSKEVYRDLNVALVTADYTRQDPVIGQYLEKYGRSGVPTYLLFPADGGEPEVLPNILQNDILANALRRAAPAEADRQPADAADPASQASR